MNPQQVDQKVHIFKFVLTGGPCSGKTTAFDKIKEYLKSYDYRVYMVPEAATMLFINGVTFEDLKFPERVYAMQQSVLGIQLHVEKSFENVARSTGHKCVLLCDRGCMDGSAYMDRELFCNIVREYGTDIPLIRDARYDSVMHLVSAADGAESFYSLENNLARSEAMDFARNVDVNNQHAWSGHPHHFIFDNTHPTFEAKLDALVSRIASELGLPHPRQVSSTAPPTLSYTLKEFPSEDNFPPDCKVREQTITYLHTTLPPDHVFPPHPTGTMSPYVRMGLDQSTETNITDNEDLNINSGIDHLVEPETGSLLTRRVVARYVCKRTPILLNRTCPPPPPTVIYPSVPPPSTEFPLSLYPNTDPVTTYEMVIIRQLQQINQTQIPSDLEKYYKVHMTITKEEYDYLISSQQDYNKQMIHQKRYDFINGRQPIVLFRNEDDWLQNLSQRSHLITTKITTTWMKVCTEGSQLLPLPSYLNIDENIISNSMEYALSLAAEINTTAGTQL